MKVACRDLKERVVYKEPQGMTVHQEKKEHRVTPAQLDHQDFPDHVGHQVYLEVQAYSAQKAIRVCQVIQVTRGVQALKEVRALTVKEAHLVDQDRRVKGETLGPRDLKDHKDSSERGVILEIVGCPDQLVSLVPLERQEVMDHVDREGHLDLLACLEDQGPLDHSECGDLQGRLGGTDHLGDPDQRVHRVTMADQERWERQEPKGHQV